MKHLYRGHFFRIFALEVRPQHLILLCLLLMTGGQLYADQGKTKVIEVKLGDYKYTPGDIKLVVQQPVILRLTNTDLMTPHNFIIEDDSDGLDTNVDVSPGDTVDVHLMPLVLGTHTFYCSKKFLFLDSHREKGMEGKLIIVQSD
jgi:plastocyanin